MPSGCLWVLTERSVWRRPHVVETVVGLVYSRSAKRGTCQLEPPGDGHYCIEAPLLARVSTGESSSSDYRGTTRDRGEEIRELGENDADSGMLTLSRGTRVGCYRGTNGAARRATRHSSRVTTSPREKENRRGRTVEARRRAMGRTFGQTTKRHERLVIEFVRSFVRSVPCSHRALQSATDSPPLTPLQRPSTPLRPSSPSGEENRKHTLPPLPLRGT